MIAAAAVECVIWFFAASILWSLRNLLVGPSSSQAADNARFALVVYAATGVNVIALLAFLLRRRGWSWWLLTAVQTGDLVTSLLAALLLSPTWWLITGGAALTLTLRFLFARAVRVPAVFGARSP